MPASLPPRSDRCITETGSPVKRLKRRCGSPRRETHSTYSSLEGPDSLDHRAVHELRELAEERVDVVRVAFVVIGRALREPEQDRRHLDRPEQRGEALDPILSSLLDDRPDALHTLIRQQLPVRRLRPDLLAVGAAVRYSRPPVSKSELSSLRPDMT